MYEKLDTNETAIWSLLLASGYLKVVHHQEYSEREDNLSEPAYELALMNLEMRRMFYIMVGKWFRKYGFAFEGKQVLICSADDKA